MSTDLSAGGTISSFSDPSTLVPVPTSRELGQSPRRRVLHVINGEHYSGAERVQDLLASRLPASGYDVHFACVKPGRFEDARAYQDAPVFSVPMRSRLDWRAFRRLSQLVEEHGYDLIHAHTPRTLMISAPLSHRKQLPLIYHVHSPTVRDSTRPIINRLNALTERVSLSKAARLIAVSESLGRHMHQLGMAQDRIEVVPNGVPRIVPTPDHAVPRDEWTIGTLALFRPRKGTEILLHALHRLRVDGFRVRLRAVGGFETDDYERSLRKLADDLGVSNVIDWVGFQTDVNDQLSKMDVFVLPSLFGEGLPMVVLEAMAAGIPVVATYVEGVPEAIRDGQEGRLARPGDDNDLALAIRSMVTGEVSWEMLRQNALTRQRELFSDVRMAQGVARVYDEVLQAARLG